MPLHVKCQTTYAILLLGVNSSSDPTLRFPANSDDVPGLLVKTNPSLGINEQFFDYLEKGFFRGENLRKVLVINQEYQDRLTLPDGQEATLYVGTLELKESHLDPKWKTIPQIMRDLPQDRGRLPFLRAWQVLAGGLSGQTKAVDLAEALRHLPVSPE